MTFKQNAQRWKRSLTRILPFGLAGLVIAAAIIFGLAVRSGYGHLNPPPSTSLAVAQKPSTVNVPVPEKLDAVLVSLKPTGFDPAEVTCPHKKFLLIIHNQSGVANISLSFDGGFAKRPNGKHSPKQRHFGGVVDLPPGRYHVTEAGHSRWVLTLNITDKQ